MPIAMVASLLVSAVLIALLIPLAITSLNSVKGKMAVTSWKKLQKLSYAFYGLTYVHIVLMLVPTISSTGQRAALSLAVYTVLFGAYAVMRVAKGMRSKRTASEAAA